jgi:hypothetical protein
MPRLRATLVLAALLAPLLVQGQAIKGPAPAPPDPTRWRFVYPNAKAVVSIDWAQIRQSPAGAMIREKFLTSGVMPAIPGIELMNDIDRVLISSPGKNSDDDSPDSSILIAIQGHFDAAQVRQLFARFGAKPQSYNSFQVYRPQAKKGNAGDAKDMAFVMFDSQTILFGDAPSVFSALDRSQFSSSPVQDGSLIARVKDLDANYELWVIMDAAEVMSNDRLADLFHGGDWASQSQGFEAGLKLRAGLAAEIILRFSSDAAAKHVTEELTRMLGLAAKDKSSNAQMQAIAKKLKFNVDGSAAKISLRLTEQDLEKSAQAFAAGLKAGERSAGNANPRALASAAPVPAKLTPSNPEVIRIEGLDDGPREIPYHPDPSQ